MLSSARKELKILPSTTLQRQEFLLSAGLRRAIWKNSQEQQAANSLPIWMRSVSYTHLRAQRRTPLYSSAASDVYKRQTLQRQEFLLSAGLRRAIWKNSQEQQAANSLPIWMRSFLKILDTQDSWKRRRSVGTA